MPKEGTAAGCFPLPLLGLVFGYFSLAALQSFEPEVS